MDLNLSNAVLTATFSNEIPNLITGTIQLAGAPNSIGVELQGNFLRDIAGCRLEITNHVPRVDHALLAALHRQQRGFAGEMTASRRTSLVLRKHAPPASAAIVQPRGSLKNLVFFEWFNEQGQRVVIQAWHWTLKVSSPGWALPRAQEAAHLKSVRARRKEYLLERGK